MEKSTFIVEPEFCFYRDVERTGMVVGTSSPASNGMMHSLESDRVLNTASKLASQQAELRWKMNRMDGIETTRVGSPSRKLRKMHNRNIILTVFDNLVFMPFYLLEQSLNQPKRAFAVVTVLICLFFVSTTALSRFDADAKISSQIKIRAASTVQYLKHAASLLIGPAIS